VNADRFIDLAIERAAPADAEMIRLILAERNALRAALLELAQEHSSLSKGNPARIPAAKALKHYREIEKRFA